MLNPSGILGWDTEGYDGGNEIEGMNGLGHRPRRERGMGQTIDREFKTSNEVRQSSTKFD